MDAATHSDRIANALVSADMCEAKGDFTHLSAAQQRAVEQGLARLHASDATGAHAVSTILDRTVRMPVYRLEDAQRAFATLARKAAERGLPVPTLTEVSRETIVAGETSQVWVTCRVLGAAPVLAGWRCVATLTRLSSVELIRAELRKGTPVCTGQLLTLVCKLVVEQTRNGHPCWIAEHTPTGTRLEVTTSELVAHNPALFAERVNIFTADGETIDSDALTMRCDHCTQNRRRNLVFVLRHEDDRTLLVGSTCLNDYLGTDALGAWFVWSRLHEAVSMIGGWSDLYDLDAHAEWLATHAVAATRSDKMQALPIALVDFLAACVAEIRTHGYVSGSDAYKSRVTEEPRTATGRKVWTAYQLGTHTPTTDFARATEILAWVATLDRDAEDRYGELSYAASLARECDWSADGVTIFGANMIASSVRAYIRAQARAAEQAAANNEHIGRVGETLTLAVTVTRRYGSWVTARDAEGRTVCWQQRKDAPAIGDALTIKGTVSEHGEFRGTRQTNLRKVKRS